MSDTPLYDFLKTYRASEISRFHMPGHKGAFPPLLQEDLCSLDITEIQGADSLFECSGILREAERNAEKLYHSVRTLYSAGGSTLCIQTMLSLVRPRGKKIILARNSHKAAINAMALLGLEPVWLHPQKLDDSVFPGIITPKQVRNALQRHPDAAAVYLTSPDYFGILCDIRGIKAECEHLGVPLLVDNAHGAHLCVCDGKHPIRQGADLCCDSAHKTLPALTGAALLHINNPELLAGAKETMSLFGSTSPSYLIMLSTELAIRWLSTEGKTAFEQLRNRVSRIEDLFVQRGFATPSAYLRDDTRIVLDTLHGGYYGEEFAVRLRNAGMEPEFISQGAVVLLTSPFNREEDFHKLEAFAACLPKRQPIFNPVADFSAPLQVMSIRQAVLSSYELIPLEQAEGRTCADARISCPPGVPVVMPGEVIDKKSKNILKMYGINDIKVVK